MLRFSDGYAAGAPVIPFGVFPTLPESVSGSGIICQCGAADRAFQKSGQPMPAIVHPAPPPGPKRGFQAPLGLFKFLRRDNPLMRPVGFNAIPDQEPIVKPVFQYVCDIALLKSVSPAGAAAHIVQLPGDGGWFLPRVVLRKDQAHNRSSVRINNKGLPRAGRPVAQRWSGLITAPPGLFRHPPADLSGQVGGVVFIHPLYDPFIERAEGPLQDRL